MVTQAYDEYYFDVPQIFGDPMHSDPVVQGYRDQWWQEEDPTEAMANRWVARRVDFVGQESLGQEYFLVNIPDPDIENLDNLANPSQLAALSLWFTDAKSVAGPTFWSSPSMWTGTLLIGNRHTSIRLEDATWRGGQIILAGGKLEMVQSTVLCGRYAANVPCPAPGQTAQEQEVAIASPTQTNNEEQKATIASPAGTENEEQNVTIASPTDTENEEQVVTIASPTDTENGEQKVTIASPTDKENANKHERRPRNGRLRD